ncbi:hypothetical protein [Haloechinothrix salitolerans]|uniref:DUF2207 domain-containing protein n=1 Tax=Haloechinothrix salitolerans TaxID=926830 RepID=A0ABW2BTX3_9PSEU
MFWKIVGVLIALWLAVTVIGFVLKGLFWLGVIGGVAFLATAAYSAIKGSDSRKQIRS